MRRDSEDLDRQLRDAGIINAGPSPRGTSFKSAGQLCPKKQALDRAWIPGTPNFAPTAHTWLRSRKSYFTLGSHVHITLAHEDTPRVDLPSADEALEVSAEILGWQEVAPKSRAVLAHWRATEHERLPVLAVEVPTERWIQVRESKSPRAIAANHGAKGYLPPTESPRTDPIMNTIAQIGTAAAKASDPEKSRALHVEFSALCRTHGLLWATSRDDRYEQMPDGRIRYVDLKTTSKALTPAGLSDLTAGFLLSPQRMTLELSGRLMWGDLFAGVAFLMIHTTSRLKVTTAEIAPESAENEACPNRSLLPPMHEGLLQEHLQWIQAREDAIARGHESGWWTPRHTATPGRDGCALCWYGPRHTGVCLDGSPSSGHRVADAVEAVEF